MNRLYFFVILKSLVAWSIFVWATLTLLTGAIRRAQGKEATPEIEDIFDRIWYVVWLGFLFAIWWLSLKFPNLIS